MFIGNGERGDFRRIADLDESVDLLKPVLQLKDIVAKFGAVDDHLAVGIVEDVEYFFGHVAIIDVHMREPTLEAGRHQLAVFGTVSHVERHLRPVAGTAFPQVAREIVRTD